MAKKYKNISNIQMAIKFKCPKCGFERLVPRERFQEMTEETFKDNKLFICNNCKIRMNPVTVEVDY